MSRTARSLVSLALVFLVLWLIWSRLHIVLFVPLPWWGLLIAGLLIFLALDWLVARIMRK